MYETLGWILGIAAFVVLTVADVYRSVTAPPKKRKS